MKMPAGNKLLPNFGHALVEYKNMRFLIMDRPSKSNISQFVEVKALDIKLSLFRLNVVLISFFYFFNYT